MILREHAIVFFIYISFLHYITMPHAFNLECRSFHFALAARVEIFISATVGHAPLKVSASFDALRFDAWNGDEVE